MKVELRLYLEERFTVRMVSGFMPFSKRFWLISSPPASVSKLTTIPSMSARSMAGPHTS